MPKDLEKLYFYKALGYNFVNLDKNKKIIKFSNLSYLNLQIKDCNLCQLCKSRQKAVLGVGNLNADIFLLGLQPNEYEDKNGFCEFPKELKDIFDELNISQNDIYISKLLKCLPNPKIAKEDDCIEFCKDYVFEELNLVKPKIVVCFGASVFRALSSDFSTSFQSVRGSIVRLNFLNILPTFELKWLKNNPRFYKDFRNDLLNIKEFL